MISIHEQVAVSAAPDKVWALLKDPKVVVQCVPGAELKAELAPGKYQAAIKIKFGPTIARFNGEADVTYDDTSRTCTVAGRGNDQRGASPAVGSGAIKVTGSGNSTSLTIDGSFDVSGPLEPFISTGGVIVARTLLAEFARNLSALLEPQSEAAAGEPVERVAPTAAPISAGGLLWTVVVGQFRRMFGFLMRSNNKNG